MVAGVICVSRTLAANGEDIARTVAERLRYRVVDAEVIERAAEKAGVDPARVREAEQRQPLLRRLFAGPRRRELPGDRAYQHETALSEAATAGGTTTEERLRASIREAIEEIAAAGEVVLVAHAASLALGGREGLLRVLVTGSPEMRARRLVQLSGASLSEARAAVAHSDQARADYLRRFYGVTQELPTHYDLVVNSDQLAPERSVELVLAASR
jgi:cytidylate kinase